MLQSHGQKVHSEPASSEGGSGDPMQALIAAKQRELAEITQHQVAVLQGEVAKRDEALLQADEQRRALASDFQFNLTLIAERDSELEAFEASFEELRQVLRDKEAEVSEAKVALACGQEATLKLEASHGDARSLLAAKLRDCKAEAERTKWSSEQALKAERERGDELRRRVNSAEAERASAIESERVEVSALYEAKVKQRTTGPSSVSLHTPPT
jgi:hypothetical protein